MNARHSSGRCSNARKMLGTKPVLSATSWMNVRTSSGASANSATGKRLMVGALLVVICVYLARGGASDTRHAEDAVERLPQHGLGGGEVEPGVAGADGTEGRSGAQRDAAAFEQDRGRVVAEPGRAEVQPGKRGRRACAVAHLRGLAAQRVGHDPAIALDAVDHRVEPVAGLGQRGGVRELAEM